jgi:sulfite exporter TauE/SafE
VAFAAGGFAHLGKLPGVTRWVGRGAARAARLPRPARGAVLGALTSLLPCGLLYVIYATALLAGSAAAGAVTMLGFALGSLPALLLAQVNIGWIRARLSLQARANLQRLALLAAAVLLAWRGWSQLGGGGGCCGAT